MVKKLVPWLGLALSLLLAFILSCGNSHDRFWDTDDNICGQEPCYEGPFEPPWISAHDYDLVFIDQYQRELSCDNKVLETENILTFSDASSDGVKIQYAGMAETAFRELKTLFEISSSAELGIVDLHTKITIYSNRYLYHNQSAVFYGFILFALDSPHWGSRVDDPDFIPWYRAVIKHETTHVIQFYLCGRGHHVDIWFTEGLAEWVSGDLPIVTWEQVEEWLQNPEHINPIKIHKAADYPLPLDQIGEYYSMFGLSVQYLLDPKGRGRNIMDVKSMFLDIGNHIMAFADAFELHMGLTLKEYEDHFFEWMEAYLPPTCDSAAGNDWKAPEWKRAFEGRY